MLQAGVLEGRLDDEGIQMFQHVGAGIVMAAPPGCDAGQQQVLSEKLLAERGEEREQGGALEGSRPQLVGDSDPAVANGIGETRDTQERVLV